MRASAMCGEAAKPRAPEPRAAEPRAAEMRPDRRTLLVLILAVVLLSNGASGLRDVHLQSPLAVKAGSTVTLRCTYDLEHDSLYTVKWYKGRSEFFRYTPKELPNTQVFPLNGISVDVHNSNSNQVVLNNAQVPITGKYRCEVSADAPSFQTLMASSTLRVVGRGQMPQQCLQEAAHHDSHLELMVPFRHSVTYQLWKPEPPSSHPSMQVDKLRYSASDRLRANCSVPTSLPPANVTWTVNGVPVMPHTMTNAPFNCTGSGLSKRCEVLSLLDTELQGASFHLGTLRVECSARVWSLYYGAVHRDVVEEKPRLGASVLGNRESAGFAPRFQCPWGLLLAVGFLLCRAHRR